MKLQRVEDESPIEPTPVSDGDRLETLEDYSIRVRCYPDPAEGNQEFFVVLRDVRGSDLQAIGQWRKQGETEVGMNSRLITRLCTNWNGRPGITLKELENVRGVNLMLLAEATASFLGANSKS